jgi:phospholipase D1/2
MKSAEPTGGILAPGVNCWRVERARRVALLIDGAAYFAAFREAVLRARRSIFIIGWDINSRIPLTGDSDPADDFPIGFGDFLNAAVTRRRGLHAYVLAWDFAMLYALDREFFPLYRLGWRTHRRLHFHLDDAHPLGGSQHQKIVVIDDAVAFVGGLDFTKGRWDTSEHRPNETRRRTPEGENYPPFHDVQMMVDDDAAAALGELARERWRRATGDRLRAPRRNGGDPWPVKLQPWFTDAEIAIARTEPCYRNQPQVEEVKQLYLDAINAAKRWIYIENQYFTAPAIGAALGKRLAQPNGPEVVVVSRVSGGGWLEENTMGTLRARLISSLQAQDRHRRLRVYYPDRADLGGEPINLHSKLMVVDDCFLRVGSANLNNRSMGYDSECDLAVESANPRIREAIDEFRNRLLAEHLGVAPDIVAEKLTATQSLIAAIEALQGGERSLKPLKPQVDLQLDGILPDSSVIDPEQPVDPDQLADEFLSAEERRRVGSRMVLIVAMLVLVSGLAAAWRWTPLQSWVNPGTLVHAAKLVQDSPAAPLWVLAAYAVASLTAFPITLMVVATVLVFGAALGFIYSLTGSLLGASLSFWLGHAVGRNTVRRLAGSRLNDLSRRLARRGVMAMFVLRLLPVAPFTVVNLVAGASHVRFRDFALGTVLGMSPGIMAVTIFSDWLAALLADSSPLTLAILALAAVGLLAGSAALRYWLQHRSKAAKAGDLREK